MTDRQANGRRAGLLLADVVLLFWPFLFSLPMILAGSPTRALFLAVALAAIAQILALGSRVPLSQRARLTETAVALALLFATYFAMTSIAILRAPSNLVEVNVRLGLILSYAFMAILGVLAFRDTTDYATIKSRINFLFLSLPIFIAVNVALVMAFGTRIIKQEVHVAIGNTSETLGYVGIHLTRLSALPGIIGSNNIGGTASVASIMAIGLLYFELIGRRRVTHLGLLSVLVFLDSFAILWADSRGAMGYVILAVLAAFLLRRLTVATLIKVVLAFSTMSAVIIGRLFDALTNSSLASVFVRTGTSGGSLGVGTGRSEIWKAALDVLSSFDPAQVFGYGYLGQYNAGISLGFLTIFKGYNDYPHLHNAALQTIFDIGYLGEIIFFAASWICVDIVARTRFIENRSAKILLAVALFLFLDDCTEVATTFYQDMIFVFLIGTASLSWTLSRYTAPRSLNVHAGGGLADGRLRRVA